MTVNNWKELALELNDLMEKAKTQKGL